LSEADLSGGKASNIQLIVTRSPAGSKHCSQVHQTKRTNLTKLYRYVSLLIAQFNEYPQALQSGPFGVMAEGGPWQPGMCSINFYSGVFSLIKIGALG
jgi:hypothetical protein